MRAKIPVWDDGRSKHGKSSQTIERKESTTHKECYLRAKIPVWDSDGRSKHGKSSQTIERKESTTHKECYLRAKIPVWDDRRSKHGKSSQTIERLKRPSPLVAPRTISDHQLNLKMENG